MSSSMRVLSYLCVKSPLVFPQSCRQCHRPLQFVIRRSLSEQKTKDANVNPFVKFLQSLKWVPIPLGVGFTYIAYQQYGHIVKREKRQIQNAQNPEELVAKDWQVRLYRALPLKAMSRLWGKANSVNLPEWLRGPLLRSYIWAFDCNLEEAAIKDLKHYKNLGEFFKRRLKPGCRPLDQNTGLVSPSDGKILHYGRVKRGVVEQVKGVTYTLQRFLGPVDLSGEPETDGSYHASLTRGADTELYHCVIYLAPGDYHGFHSPTRWVVTHRRHFPGDLLSVNPGIARWVKGLFNLNERAVYLGEWQHGFFSMAAVGATNVGSIKVYHDRNLETNQPGMSSQEAFEQSFSYSDLKGLPMAKGDHFGEFNLGSTIVLVFEAPKSFQFSLEEGQVIRYGQALGTCE